LPNGVKTLTGAGSPVQIIADPTFGSIYRATRGNYVLGRSTTQHYTNFFVQDSWQIGSRFTFRPGVRYEQQKLIGTVKDFQWDGNWAPRIGATYDVTGSGRSKVYANWGRFYAKVPNDLAARALSADAGISRADYFDANLTRPVPEGVSAAGQTRHFILAGTQASDFDPNAKSTYMDESLVGFEFEAIPGMNVGVRYIHRNMPRILEDVGTAQMVAYDLGLPGLDSVEYFITNVNSDTPVTAFPGLPAAHFEDPLHHYDAVEFTADKRLSNNWSLQSSYRWSRLWGNFEGFYRNDNGQSDPAISSLFDFPTDDPSYTQIGTPQFGYRGDIRFLGGLGAGLLPNDRTHQVKLYGTYNIPIGVNFGAGIQLMSGKPLTALAANPNYNSRGEIPMTPRGGRLRYGGRLQEADAVGSRHQCARGLRAWSGKPAGRVACRRLQPRESPAGGRLQHAVRVPRVRNRQSGLRAGRRSSHPPGIPDSDASPNRRAVRVLTPPLSRPGLSRPAARL
jgi:hypothetical protein